VVGSIPLQASDLDGFLQKRVLDTGSFTQDVNGANAGTGSTDWVCVEDNPGRTHQILAGYLLNETWNIDMRRTRTHTGRVETIEAAIRLMHGLSSRKGRIDLGEVALDLGYV